MRATAIILERPGSLRLDDVTLNPPGESDAVVDILTSGISTGTEKLLWQGTMPWFPGLEYPLVPGYEAIGDVVDAPTGAAVRPGDRVFVGGANCYQGARGLFGASASRVVVPAEKLTPVDRAWGDNGILLALAATAHHAIAPSPNTGPTLVVGHGTVGRLLTRQLMARGDPAPIVWEQAAERRDGDGSYVIGTAESDTTKTYSTIYDASGDPAILDTLVSRLAPGGEIVLAGFYANPLSFSFPPAFMREARFRIAAEWKQPDMDATLRAIRTGALSLDGLISHQASVKQASTAYEQAFNDPACLKMTLTWRASE